MPGVSVVRVPVEPDSSRKAHEYSLLNASHQYTASSCGMASKIAPTPVSSPVHPARFHPG